MSNPIPLANLIAQSPPSDKLFSEVPATFKAEGRVAGFEAIRDMILSNWRDLVAEFEIPLPTLLKLVLETDRHALFAAISEEKLGDASDAKLGRYKWFQGFLEGEIDIPPSPAGNKHAELPSANEVTDGRDEDV